MGATTSRAELATGSAGRIPLRSPWAREPHVHGAGRLLEEHAAVDNRVVVFLPVWNGLALRPVNSLDGMKRRGRQESCGAHISIGVIWHVAF